MLKFRKYLASIFRNYNKMFESYSIVLFINCRFKGNNHIWLQGSVVIRNYARFLMIHRTNTMTPMMRKIPNMVTHQLIYFFCLHTGSYSIYSNSECFFDPIERFLLFRSCFTYNDRIT